ncbi:MAG: 16S rRNA (cytosine(1402)-N(4))-methyltransferase RsmH [Clostridia bacterium]|nr:16S rRNA (cytosine(1402)-N(4))-methyltransferase RsmH [Clostridia bacterium]
MEFSHVSVLLNETIDAVNVKEGGRYADFTMGGGGHSALILNRGGILYGFDRDIDAINVCKKRFEDKKERFNPIHSSFENVKREIESLGVDALDGIIADLGVSSYQLDEAERGFSYMHDAPLDMRMDRREGLSAKEVVNTYSEEKLCEIITKYGEEKWAVRITKFICEAREKKPIETTFELVDIIKAAVPQGARKDGPHPAKRTFQAIRIEVNGELRILEKAVRDGVELLKKGGRMAVITFHSLEDRIVKETFNSLANACTCPKNFPVCVCGKKDSVKVITRKPILPSDEEIEVNPRSRSAKLRVCEKII